MNLKKAKHRLRTLAAAALLAVIAAYWFHSVALEVIAVALYVALFIAKQNWRRCPHCGAFWGRVEGKPRFYKQCGKKLEGFEDQWN